MELIGSDLEELLCRMPHKTFSVKTALMVGLQVIDRLEALHRIGYLHRDVKPDNLAIGLAHNDNVIYLFDFGLALPILAEVPVEKKGKAIGTRAFMSCRAHQGLQLSPADDLESLIFTIFYLIEGTLPWLKGTADIHKVYTMKKHLNRNSFRNTSIPKELFEVLQYLRTLTPQRKLDYLKIKFAFLQGLKSIGE